MYLFTSAGVKFSVQRWQSLFWNEKLFSFNYYQVCCGINCKIYVVLEKVYDTTFCCCCCCFLNLSYFYKLSSGHLLLKLIQPLLSLNKASVFSLGFLSSGHMVCEVLPTGGL
jgi:hypothetical protein